MSRFLKLDNRGDTIVEVLLAIAIVSAILGAAYVSVNQSSFGIRQSQERSEALKFTEAQLELLASGEFNPGSFTGGDKCISDQLAVTSDESICQKGPDGRYRVFVRHNNANNTYLARAEWDKIGGGEQEFIEIFYRAEQ